MGIKGNIFKRNSLQFRSETDEDCCTKLTKIIVSSLSPAER